LPSGSQVCGSILAEFTLLVLGHKMLSRILFRLRLSHRGHFVDVGGSSNKKLPNPESGGEVGSESQSACTNNCEEAEARYSAEIFFKQMSFAATG
jgi:hypothetical protein